jgi:hypothetical protein
LHSFGGRSPFSEETQCPIAQLKSVYGVDYGAEASHMFVEERR